MGTLPILDDGNIYIPTEDGKFVSQKHVRIAQIVKDYNPELELQWIPPDKRGEEKDAFRVVHFPPGKPPYVVTFAEECDERLLAKIFQADAAKQGNILNILDAMNSAQEIYQAKRIEEDREEAKDFAVHVARNPKSSYWHNGYNFEESRGWNSERRGCRK